MLFVLFFSWRAALTALVAIALSFVVAAFVLDRFGQTFNVVVLAGLVMVLAAVVHDAVENVADIARSGQRARRRSDLDGRDDPDGGARNRCRALWATIVFALALVPIFLMGGLSGDSFFPPLAAAGLVALLASLARRDDGHARARRAVVLRRHRSGASRPPPRGCRRGYRGSSPRLPARRSPQSRSPLIVLVAGVLVDPAVRTRRCCRR